MEYKNLSNGLKVPVMALGTYNFGQVELEHYLIEAIKSGYRYFDFIQSCNNEPYIKNAIKKSGIKRKELILSVLLDIQNYDYHKCIKSVQDSLSKLECDYLDMLVINNISHNYNEVYLAVQECYKKGYIKAIGTAGFYKDDMEFVYKNAEVKPVLNQLYVHPYNQIHDQKICMDKNNIAFAASLLLKDADDNIFGSYLLNDLCVKYKKSPVQIIYKWMIKKGCIVLMSNIGIDQLQSSIDIFDFDLDDEDMVKLNEYNLKVKNYITNGDYTTIELIGRLINQGLIK